METDDLNIAQRHRFGAAQQPPADPPTSMEDLPPPDDSGDAAAGLVYGIFLGVIFWVALYLVGSWLRHPTPGP